MATGLYRLREFRLLWISGLFVSFGAQMSLLALPLLVLRETGSAVRAGAVETVAVASLLATMLPSGFLADTTERLRLQRWCVAGNFLVVAAVAVTAATGHTPFPLVLLVAGAAAVITGVAQPASLGLLRAIVPAADIGTAAARMQARSAAARLVGPLIGGALFAWHPAAPFAVEASALLLASICLAAMRTRSVPAPRSGSVGEQLGAGVSFIWHHHYLRTVLVVFGLGMNMAFSALSFVSLAIASDSGRSGATGGLVVSMTAVGSLAGALIAPVLHPERRSALLIAATCWACPLAAAVLAATHPPLAIGVVMAACTAVAAVGNNGFLVALLLMTPADMFGRVQSAAGFVSSLAQPIGPIMAGVLLGAWGAGPTYATLGGIFLIGAVVITPRLVHYRAAAVEPALAVPEA
jgi:MFS family permease